MLERHFPSPDFLRQNASDETIMDVELVPVEDGVSFAEELAQKNQELLQKLVAEHGEAAAAMLARDREQSQQTNEREAFAEFDDIPTDPDITLPRK